MIVPLWSRTRALRSGVRCQQGAVPSGHLYPEATVARDLAPKAVDYLGVALQTLYFYHPTTSHHTYNAHEQRGYQYQARYLYRSLPYLGVHQGVNPLPVIVGIDVADARLMCTDHSNHAFS